MDTHRFIQALECAGYKPRSYSGRAMYGRQCIGIDVDQGTSLFRVGLEISIAMFSSDEFRDGLINVDDIKEDLETLNIAQDNMGRGSIVYFPEQAWLSDFENDDEVDD